MYNSWNMANRTLPFDANQRTSNAQNQALLSGKTLTALRVIWVGIALAAFAILITSLPGYASKFSGQLFHTPASQATNTTAVMAIASGIASLASSLLSFGLALLLFQRRFEEPAAAALAFYLVMYSVIMAGPWEHWEAFWLEGQSIAFLLQGLIMATPTFALFALFPNGRIQPGWMRWVLLGSLPWTFFLVYAGPFQGDITPGELAVLAIGFIALISLSVYGQIRRFRYRSNQLERQQTKWVVYGFTLWFAYVLVSSVPYYYLTSLPPGATVPWWTGLSELGWWLSLSIVPLSLTLAITRYRLWNIDIVINRSLVYGGLVLGLIAIYLVIIAGLGWLFQASDSLFIPLIATGVAILVFQPMRLRLQNGVNRMMYGDRDEPAAVLSRLGEQLEGTASPQATMTGIVDTVGTALKLPYVAIELGDPESIVARYGQSTGRTHRLPLIYQGQAIGNLIVSPRVHDEGFSVKDLELLESITRQTGVVAYNAYLTADLRQARQRLVSTREEERRRIRRDLHDGLGPQLASLSLKLDAAENLLDSKPAKAVELLSESKRQIKDAVADIRRLVYNLRPPALDELGLMSALRERAATYSGGQQMHVTIKGPKQLPALPAAVEVAAYRIIQEAINNAGQHGNAEHCWVTLHADSHLSIEIEDDGSGLPPDLQLGVGLTSMRERTEELSGEFSIRNRRPNGVHIQVTLPLPAEEAD